MALVHENFTMWAQCILILLLSFVVIGLGIIGIKVLIKCRENGKFNRDQKIVLTLFIFHAFFGMIQIPVNILRLLSKCSVFFVLEPFRSYTASVQINCTLGLSIERYLTVFAPYWYERQTFKFTPAYLYFCFVNNTLWIGLSVKYPDILRVAAIIIILGSIIIAVVNFKIYRDISGHLSKIAATTVPSDQISKKKEQLVLKKKEAKAFIINLLIVLTYIVTWIPYQVLTFIMDDIDRERGVHFLNAEVVVLFNPIMDIPVYVFVAKNRRRILINLFRFS